MNTQDILKHGSTKLDIQLDYSDYYDYELVENVLGKIDITLDYSEYYDYQLGDNNLDYIYYETFISIGNYILTEDNFIIATEDNYLLEHIN